MPGAKVAVNLSLLVLAGPLQLALLEVVAGVDNERVLLLRGEIVVIDSEADGNDRLQDVVYEVGQDIAVWTVAEVSFVFE
ncbi:uncharacterized protein EV420DRAFT_1529440 [Desarmillaria tabescens]|uniref:Secreted protein n=1 Tax=Armillaria tabescens TaxID=1929756 RepID=A0AA39N8I1_ARMTA|nr:uncharacterized protein EV420DRAFT_1529440 [Desarmillaria tabescens]KAK0460974.1 hypothetical protein EV420DRAFT_1529440 [Desarmillaria tabescens]